VLYTVGEMAKELGIPASTLRYYDREGLLPFIQRSGGGMRMFSEKDAELLRVIGCLKRSGMSIREIRAFLGLLQGGDETLPQRLALFAARREEVERQLAALRETLEVLEYKCWYYETALRSGEEAVDRVPPEEMPEGARRGLEHLNGACPGASVLSD